MNNSIVLITKDPFVDSLVRSLLQDTYSLTVFENVHKSIAFVYDTCPDLIIVDFTENDKDTANVLRNIKEDYILSQISILVILSDDLISIFWEELPIDDYIRYSQLEKELKMKVQLCQWRSSRIVEVNPLTKLPGNITIIKELQKRIEKSELFAVAYADLDYFKPYNDRYGFSRGDEVIKMVARLIYNIVKGNQQSGSFVGHIGGDDFIYIMDIDLIEKTTESIIHHYDRIIPSFYDYDDRLKGYIESIDREGKKRAFPIMYLSIGITHNRHKNYIHYGEITQTLVELKNYAKTKKMSFYIVDRRI